MASAPQRSCAVCRKKLPQAQLQRWVIQDDQVVTDNKTKLDGRGYYSCTDCAEKAREVIIAKHNKRSA